MATRSTAEAAMREDMQALGIEPLFVRWVSAAV